MSNTDFNLDENSDFAGIDVGLPFSSANFNGPQPTIRQNLDVPGLISPIASVVVIGTTSTLAINESAERRGIVFFNPNQQAITITPANIPAILGAGIPVPPGQSVEFIPPENSLIRYNCGWNAVAAADSSPLTILEFI